MVSANLVDWVTDKSSRGIGYAGFVCHWCKVEIKKEFGEHVAQEEIDAEADRMIEEHAKKCKGVPCASV